MPPANFKFGGGASQTILHPLVLAAMIIVIVLTFLLARKFIIIPILLSTFLIPQGQQIVAGGVHLYVLRLIVLAGLVRMVVSRKSMKGRIIPGGLISIDKAVLLWVSFHVVAFIALNRQMGAVVNQIGYIWDILGGYFLLRFLIRDEKDIDRSIKCLAVLALILASCMVREQMTGQNIFGRLGGVRAVSEVRDGRIRSQAVFQHSLLAGTFGATSIPLFVLLWKREKAKLTKIVAIAGALGGTVMTITASGSTPLLACAGGIVAVCAWPLRKRMRILRWAVVLLIMSLSLAMKAPVWFLISHISLTGGSSSYHRALLVDEFVRHFPDWWLMGTNDNQSWGGVGSDMWDTSNRYVEEGETGGLAAFVCFLGILYFGFAKLGTSRKRARGNRDREWLFWLLGCALFAHATAFFGVSYFDQIQMVWLLLLAMICAVTTSSRAVRPTSNGATEARLPSSQPEYDLVSPGGIEAVSCFSGLGKRLPCCMKGQSLPGKTPIKPQKVTAVDRWLALYRGMASAMP